MKHLIVENVLIAALQTFASTIVGSNICFIYSKTPLAVGMSDLFRLLTYFSINCISSLVISSVSCKKRMRIGLQNLVDKGTGFCHTTFFLS